MNYYLIKIKQLINNFVVGPKCGSSLECVYLHYVCVCLKKRICVVAKRAIKWDKTKQLPQRKVRSCEGAHVEPDGTKK